MVSVFCVCIPRELSSVLHVFTPAADGEIHTITINNNTTTQSNKNRFKLCDSATKRLIKILATRREGEGEFAWEVHG